jgi:hypothetical protein
METSARALAAIGAVLMTSALIADNVTLVNGDYRVILSAAVVLMVVAIGCLAAAFRRGGAVLRAVCVVLAMPACAIIIDLFRRGTYVFS